MPTKTAKAKPVKPNGQKGSILQKINQSLAIIFYLMWIVIGLFFILLIVANILQGVFRQLFASPQQAPPQVEAPTETTLSGIGKVNIECIQSALSNEVIGKIIQEENTTFLTDEEKAKLEPCITEKEATPAPSPTS